jgi:hypothetical protein
MRIAVCSGVAKNRANGSARCTTSVKRTVGIVRGRSGSGAGCQTKDPSSRYDQRPLQIAMMQFLELPRELRDMIYTEMLMPTEPLPSARDTESASNWYLVRQSHEAASDSQCFISSREIPGTCASILASNRQINEEMMQIADRVQETGQLATRIDCLVRNNAHYFTWLAVPFVKLTRGRALEQQEESKQSWTSRAIEGWSWVVSFFSVRDENNINGRKDGRIDRSYSTIERLWMDIRPFESTGSTGAGSATSRGDGTCWAICAALKHMFDNGPDVVRRNRRVDCVDEVVLNVVPHRQAACESDGDTLFIPESSHERATEVLRNDLVDVWDKIWSATDGRDIRARLYRTLLEKIRRVRICVDGVTFRTRGLAVELERGRAEMRRIQMR